VPLIPALTENICFPLSPSKARSTPGTRIWRISEDGPTDRSGSVPLCVPEGLLVSSGLIAAAPAVAQLLVRHVEAVAPASPAPFSGRCLSVMTSFRGLA